VGLFEEEEEGTSITSEVVKVKGEDPATLGCLREDRVRRYAGNSVNRGCVPLCSLGRNPRDRNDSPASGIKQ